MCKKLNKVDKIVGQNVRSLRRASGLSQLKLAEKLGISVETVSRLENGKIQISSKNIEKIAKLFKIPFFQLFVENPTEDLKIFKTLILSSISKKIDENFLVPKSPEFRIRHK